MDKNELAKRSTMDKLAALAGAGAGAAGVSAVATTVGSTSLLGTVGSAFGLTIAAATPVGWLIGGAAFGAAALYGGSKLVGAKGVSDGDTNAHRQFNSDVDKQRYMRIATKLSEKDSVVAKKLLKKLSNDYNEWIDSAIDGLKKGTMFATDIIKMCCEVLGEDEKDYLNENDFSLTDIELTIKISFLMALADGEFTLEEHKVIRQHIIDFFELSPILDESEINLIFSQAESSEEEKQQLYSLSFEEIQTLFVTFFLMIDNDRLKLMLTDFLMKIAEVDDEISVNELELYNIFIGLQYAELYIEEYLVHLEKLTRVKSDFLYSNLGNNSKTYAKKVTNALNTYANGIPINSVITLYDATIFGKADEGFIVTPYAIITNKANCIRVIPLASVYAIDSSKNNKIILYREPDKKEDKYSIIEMLCASNKINEFVIFLENIININNKNRISNISKA